MRYDLSNTSFQKIINRISIMDNNIDLLYSILEIIYNDNNFLDNFILAIDPVVKIKLAKRLINETKYIDIAKQLFKSELRRVSNEYIWPYE